MKSFTSSLRLRELDHKGTGPIVYADGLNRILASQPEQTLDSVGEHIFSERPVAGIVRRRLCLSSGSVSCCSAGIGKTAA
jgi:hypothetical protein